MSLVYLQGGMRPVCKESQNGLENPEDRRSAGWHGNQYVRLRRPQVTAAIVSRFDAGGPPARDKLLIEGAGSCPVSTFEALDMKLWYPGF